MLKRPEVSTYLAAASVSCIPRRRVIRQLLEAICDRFGVPETAKLLAVPTWRLEMWRDGSGMLYASQKRLIWIVWCLHFAPWKLRSTFDIITSGRFVPDPPDMQNWKPRPGPKRRRRKARKPIKVAQL